MPAHQAARGPLAFLSPAKKELLPTPHPRTLGWIGTTALAVGGSNQSLFLIAALFAGQDGTSGQGSAAVPLLIGGLLLSLAGWDPAPPIADAGKAAQDRVRPAMERCLTLVRQQAEATGIEIESSFPWNPPVLFADETRFRQILVNLLSNAVKFTARGGHVALRAQVRQDRSFAIVISDTGVGMTPEEVEVARQPFRQVDSAMTRRYPGTGLGLPLAEELTRLHGGDLEVHSEPGVGTTVVVVFPAKRVRRDQARLVT